MIELAQSVADLAERVRALEIAHRLDFGTTQFVSTAVATVDSVSVNLPFATPTLYSPFAWDALTPERIYCESARPGARACFIGYITWQSAPNGWRGLNVVTFTAAGAVRFISTVCAWDANASTNTNQPFCAVNYIYDPTDYFCVNVVQTSGGALNMDYCRCNVFMVR